MCRANSTPPAGSLPVLQPSVFAGHQEQCVLVPGQHCVLSLCTALLASTCRSPVAVTALSRCSCRFAQVIPGPCSCSIFMGKVLPTWREMPLWVVPLCILLHWLQPLLTINMLAKVWLAAQVLLWRPVSHRHQGTESVSPCDIKASNEGMWHRQGEPWE